MTHQHLTKPPVVERGYDAVVSVIDEAVREGRIGVDLEFSPISGPTIIGVGSRNRAAASPWNQLLGRRVIDADVQIVAYAGVGADRPVLEKALGIVIPLERIEDPMLKHWCVRPDLASVPKSSYGEDRDDSHVMGMMNIWVATMLLHDVSRWKGCLSEIDSNGEARNAALAEICVARKRICPVHDEPGYCALDAWYGLVDDYALDEQMRVLGIPRAYYEWRRRVAAYCYRMQWDQDRGLSVDIEAANAIDETIKTKKAALFPARFEWDGPERIKKQTNYRAGFDGCECADAAEKRSLLRKVCAGHGNRRTAVEKVVTAVTVPGRRLKKPRVIWDGPFNPNSPAAALQWFSDHGIQLRDKFRKPTTAKPVLLDAVEKRLKPYGLSLDPLTGIVNSVVDDESDPVELPEALDMLVRMGQKTVLGKGLASWIDLRYLYNGRLRARFNPVGTSTVRLSSSKPNCQNIPARGFGTEVRRIIMARPGYCLIKADSSQLEFRVMLWFAGLDPNLSDGAFEQLVKDGGDKWEQAARLHNMKPRDVVKSFVHAFDYLETIRMLTEQELSGAGWLKDRGAGALRVYDGRDGLPRWTFRGRIVCFTGKNLATRLFGSATHENRAKALELQGLIEKRYPALRELQMRVAKDIEESFEVRLPFGAETGHRVPLYGREPEDDLKFALAVYGQGGGATYIQEGMMLFDDRGIVQDLQVHDEHVFTSHLWPEATDAECLEFMQPMVHVSKYLPGFTCPAKVSRSLEPGTVYTDKAGREHTVKTHNWKETKELGTIRNE